MARHLFFIFYLLVTYTVTAQDKTPAARITEVDSGWAGNSVNTVIFRKHSLVTHRDTQYIAFYDPEGRVVLGKRRSGARQWQLTRTGYRGDVADAHRSISIIVDGNDYLHMAWDHHNSKLRYCRSISPGSLVLTAEMPMTGSLEEQVSYPEFYKLPDENLLFFYRDGGSGRGNLVINRYNIHTQQWTRLHDNLVDGEGKRNAYWQAFIDAKGTIHLSWVWRETPDVASNHDLCYARSADGGKTWTTSTGQPYGLPITAATAEYTCRIPVNSGLINQTSICADAGGRPYIASYWCDPGDSIPQYRIVYLENNKWMLRTPGFRKTAFHLSGAGTKRIPLSRPQLLVWNAGSVVNAVIIFRDEERGNKVSIAVCKNIGEAKWNITDLTTDEVGSWEPTYDTGLWKEKSILNLFVQKVEQTDAEGKANTPPQMVKVLEWKVVER